MPDTNLDALFTVANGVAMVGWVMLVAAPVGSRWLRIGVGAVGILLAVVYGGLIASSVTRASGGFGSLAAVAELFGHRGVLLAGWVHYLVFDLMVGLWERAEADRVCMPRWWLVPCLAMTLMVGPVGWLAFLAARRLHGRRREASTAP